MDWSLQHNQFYAFLNRGSFVAYFPMPSGMYRVAVGYPKRRAPAGDVSFAELECAVDKCAPPGARVIEVQQSARFRINQRRVERHSVGRVFLAGDAAHIHSVVGAQGMNTGIQDAFNLGWKLASVVQNHALPELLDTYQTERAPVVHRLVRGTRAFTRLVLFGSPLATAARRSIVPRVMSSPGRQRTLARALSQIDVSYRSRTRGSKQGRLGVGDRAPNAQLRNRCTGTEETLFDVFDHDHHTLMILGSGQPNSAAAVADYTGQVRVVHIVHDHESTPADAETVLDDPEGQVAERYSLSAGGYALIRPDGYVGALGNARDATDLHRYLQRIFA